MDNIFCVTGIITDLSQKSIVVETNFKVNSKSVSYSTVKVYDITEDVNSEVPYKLEVDKSNIIIALEHYPHSDRKYYIVVQNIRDLIGRTLDTLYEREITFTYDVKTKTKINLPSDEYVSRSKDIEFNVAISDEDEGVKYRFQISSDIAFYSNECIVVTDKDRIYNSDTDKFNVCGFTIKDNILSGLVQFNVDGQYYIRCRAEKAQTIVGDWSDVISFIVTTSTPMDDKSGFLDDMLYTDSLFIDELEPVKVLNKSEDLSTDSEFYIEFNKDVAYESNDNVTEDGLQYIGKCYLMRRDV